MIGKAPGDFPACNVRDELTPGVVDWFATLVRFQHALGRMCGQVTKRILVRTAFLLLATELQADITLPGQGPPQADALTVRIWRGEQVTIPLRAHYGGTGTVTFAIVQRPEHGKLSELRLLGDNRAVVTYQNDGAEGVTSDGFRYVVKAGGERVSSAAEVRISVQERPPRMVLPS